MSLPVSEIVKISVVVDGDQLKEKTLQEKNEQHKILVLDGNCLLNGQYKIGGSND